MMVPLRAVAVLVCAALLAGCASGVRGLPPVEPLALLDEDAGLYVAVPVQENQDLVYQILADRWEGLSASDAKAVGDRVSVLYAGLGEGRMELVADGSFPAVGVKAALGKKHGWLRQQYRTEAATLTYYTQEAGGVSVFVPDSGTLCAASDIRPMMERYAGAPSGAAGEWAEWLSAGGADIRFYMARPADYMHAFLGQGASMGCTAVYGSLAYDADEAAYDVTLRLRLVSKAAMPAVRTLLMFSFEFFGNGAVREVDGQTLELSGVKLPLEQLESMLSD